MGLARRVDGNVQSTLPTQGESEGFPMDHSHGEHTTAIVDSATTAPRPARTGAFPIRLTPAGYNTLLAQARDHLTPTQWGAVLQLVDGGPSLRAARFAVGVAYRALYGWAVTPAYFPVWDGDGQLDGCTCDAGRACDKPAKHPAITHGRETLPTQPTLDMTLDWFLQARPWVGNLTLLPGRRSDGVFALDADPRHGGSLATLRALGWPVDDTVLEQSGGDPIEGAFGVHAYFRWPFPGPVPTVHSGYAPGIEVLGDGAVVVLAPSMHAARRAYQWLPSAALWERPIVRAPEALAQDILARAAAHGSASGRRDVAAGAAADADNGNGIAPNVFGWSRQRVRQKAWAFYRRALWRVRNGHEGRNNTTFWLSGQLRALGFSDSDVGAWAEAFATELAAGGNDA